MKKLILITSIVIITLPSAFGQCQADFYGYLDPSCLTFDTVIFYDNSTNATTWFWDFGDSTTSTIQNPIHQYNNIGIYNVCLIITDGALCSDTICNPILVSTCATDFYHAPTDQPNTIKFFDTPTNAPYYPAYYFWDFGDSTYSNLRLPVHTYSSQGIYNVCLTAHDSLNGCVMQVCKNINVSPPNNVKISVCDGYWDDPYTWNTGQVPSSSDSVLIYNHVVLNSNITITYPGLVYIEENSSLCGHFALQSEIMTYGVLNLDILIICSSDTTIDDFSYSDFTPPNVTNMWQVGCGFGSGTYLMQSFPSESPFTCNDPPPCVVSILEIDDNIDILVYPNPTTGVIKIEAKEVESIEVMNLQGKQIYTGKVTEIDLSSQPKGIYIIKVITDKQTITQKLIKQ